MTMINTMQVRVLGAMRYAMDNGAKGAKITVMNDADPNNENRVGHDVMTISGPYDILEQVRPYAAHLPCNLEVDVEMRVSGGKATLHAVAVRNPSATGHTQPADAKAKA